MTTYFDEVFDREGKLVSRTARQVSARDLLADGAQGRLRDSYQALRQWSLDAQTEVAAWDGQTAAQRNVALKTTIDRFGKLCDGMADLLLYLNTDR